MESNNDNSPTNEYIIAAITYLPIVGFLLVFTMGKKYFVRYHAGHSILIYIIGSIFLISYIALYIFLRTRFIDPFVIDTAWGFIFSLHLLFSFIFLFYCSIQAYLGRYIVIPIITKLFYLVFNK
ncbi:MAG: hypothetical protein U0354_01815 [Candidatus Sericytochromatia bacterium]